MNKTKSPNVPIQRFDVDLDASDLARIDALIPSHSTPTTMVRLLIGAGLEALESRRVPMGLTALPRPRAGR